MQISSTTSDDGSAVTPQFSKLAGKGGFVLLLLTVTAIGSLFAFPGVWDANASSPLRSERPTDLRVRLRAASAAATRSGALMPLAISDPVAAKDRGMEVFTAAHASHGHDYSTVLC